MDNKSQYCFIAVMLFLKQPFVFGEDCKCEGLVNVFKSTMSRELFDLKMENTMLQARMDKMESMLQEKSSSTSARGLDTARFEGFENRLSSIESNRQHTIKVPTNTLKLHSFIAKALRSEKEKRIQAESNTRKHMEFFNQSISDLKIKVDFVLNSNLTYIVNGIEKVEQKMYDGLDQVKNDIRYLQSNISELQSQSNALSDKDISELGLDLVAMNKSVATDIAEIEQRMSDGFLNVKNKIKTMQTKVKKQYQVNVLIGKNVTAFETGLSTIDQDVMTMKADIKRLEKLSLISLKANKCPELPSIRNGEIFQNTNEGVRNIYGSVAEYTCNIGYSLNGNRSIKVYNRQCQADRTWSGKQPTCDGCTLPGDPRYTYMDFYGFYKDPGSLISDGTILTVACTTLDLYEFYASYDSDYDNNSTSTITCMNNTLSQLELDCPEVIPNTCMELQHGSVNVQNGYFIVSCDKGYSLDLIVPERPQCTCENNQLKSVFGGQTPACIPEKCVVPYVFDVRLSVTDTRRVSLSGGSVVEVGDFVYFNCSKPGILKYEPLNRRFQCVNGLWKEAETDRNWKLGYDGEFPACRREWYSDHFVVVEISRVVVHDRSLFKECVCVLAVCEPNCTNGGVCFKDDNCRCKHLTEGKRCESVSIKDVSPISFKRPLVKLYLTTL
ncbi:uncharacterized protein LOC123529008 isoform X2 [Mercenaria mercenaria]|uniref:uncharacterized protein LOC123529008 isoform X2 n=1 Tax=Mercenaria mercenaria TaxID=6596 RepID=UPI00234EE2C9|nr:uncharacterized protein LOC123529008 isoform X2 [Mercenaria mercenaria]